MDGDAAQRVLPARNPATIQYSFSGNFKRRSRSRKFAQRRTEIFCDGPSGNLYKFLSNLENCKAQLTSENFDFADDEDVINMCQTLLQSSARRVSWISDMAAADHYQQSKVDSKLDDMEKVFLEKVDT